MLAARVETWEKFTPDKEGLGKDSELGIGLPAMVGDLSWEPTRPTITPLGGVRSVNKNHHPEMTSHHSMNLDS